MTKKIFKILLVVLLAFTTSFKLSALYDLNLGVRVAPIQEFNTRRFNNSGIMAAGKILVDSKTIKNSGAMKGSTIDLIATKKITNSGSISGSSVLFNTKGQIFVKKGSVIEGENVSFVAEDMSIEDGADFSIEYLDISLRNASEIPAGLIENKSLRGLVIHDCNELESFSITTPNENLESLKIDNCPKITIDVLKQIILFSPNISSLKIANNSELTSDVLEDILAQFKSLKHLYLNGNENLTTIPENFQSKALKTLHLNYCENLTAIPDSMYLIENLEIPEHLLPDYSELTEEIDSKIIESLSAFSKIKQDNNNSSKIGAAAGGIGLVSSAVAGVIAKDAMRTIIVRKEEPNVKAWFIFFAVCVSLGFLVEGITQLRTAYLGNFKYLIQQLESELNSQKDSLSVEQVKKYKEVILYAKSMLNKTTSKSELKNLSLHLIKEFNPLFA